MCLTDSVYYIHNNVSIDVMSMLSIVANLCFDRPNAASLWPLHAIDFYIIKTIESVIIRV